MKVREGAPRRRCVFSRARDTRPEFESPTALFSARFASMRRGRPTISSEPPEHSTKPSCCRRCGCACQRGSLGSVPTARQEGRRLPRAVAILQSANSDAPVMITLMLPCFVRASSFIAPLQNPRRQIGMVRTFDQRVPPRCRRRGRYCGGPARERPSRETPKQGS